MEIRHKEIKGQGMFYIQEDGTTLGSMSYTKTDEHHIIIEHTNVDDVLKGRGAGKQLMSEAVSWARNKNIRVGATCTFAQALFEKVDSYQDVWDKDLKH